MHKKLKILLLSQALFFLAGGLFGPIYAIFVQEIGGDLMTAGIAYSIFAVSAGVLIYLIGRWEDHVKHQEKLVIFGFALSALGFLGYLFVQRPVDLFIVQIIFGIGEAINTPAYDGLYSKHLDKGRFASEWGLYDSMQRIMVGIAALIGGFLANAYGFSVLFIVMALLSVIGFAVSCMLIIPKKIQMRES